jgi:TetR/AcrR family transcriptional repressor of nem operon
MPLAPLPATADRILDIAQRLVQTRGFNAFSYADIATELGIRNAAVHYHFASKEILGKELLARYRTAFCSRLADIDREEHARSRLRDYAQIYVEVLEQDFRLCLCGMMAADFMTLPRVMRDEVKKFFAVNERWLEKTLSEGQRAGQLLIRGEAPAMAKLVLDTLEGGMLVSRCHGDVARLREVIRQLLALFEPDIHPLS